MNFMKLICENAVTEHSVTFYADYLCVSTKPPDSIDERNV